MEHFNKTMEMFKYQCNKFIRRLFEQREHNNYHIVKDILFYKLHGIMPIIKKLFHNQMKLVKPRSKQLLSF